MDNFNIDIYNAFMFSMKGLDVAHMHVQEWMGEDLYNAVAFAEANFMEDFVGSVEYSQAIADYTVEIVGQALQLLCVY